MSTNRTSAAEAPSASVIAEALELRRLIKAILCEDPPVAVVAAPAAELAAADDRDSAVPEVPQALRDYLQKQQTRVSELVSLLDRLDQDKDTPMCMGIAIREAKELEIALDSVTLAKVLRGEGDDAS